MDRQLNFRFTFREKPGQAGELLQPIFQRACAAAIKTRAQRETSSGALPSVVISFSSAVLMSMLVPSTGARRRRRPDAI